MPKTDLDDAFIGTCEHCKTENVKVRRIEELDQFTGKLRRYWNICFDCFKPRQESRVYGKTIYSPVRIVTKENGQDGSG